MDGDGRLRWRSFDGTVTHQPARGLGQRIADFFLQMMPVESQL
jgi:hypothetical protein